MAYLVIKCFYFFESYGIICVWGYERKEMVEKMGIILSLNGDKKT